MATRDNADLGDFLEREVYPALFDKLDSAFSEFSWKRSGENWVASEWPANFPVSVNREDGSRLFVYKDRPYWIKLHGHEGVRLLDYVNGGRKPKGAEFPAAVRKLAALAGVAFPERERTEEETERDRKKESRRSVLEDAVSLFSVNLWSEKGTKARGYLKDSRKLTDKDLEDFELGLYLSARETQKGLLQKGHTEEDVSASAVAWDKMEGYIIVPWRDAMGQPLTLYGRWQEKLPPLMKGLPAWAGKRDELLEAWKKKTPEEKKKATEKCLYDASGEPYLPKTMALPGEGTKGSPLFFDRVRNKGHKDVVLVEGLFDALVAQARGDTRVCAYVAAQLSGEQVKTLGRFQVRSATVVPDPDGGGDAGGLRCLESLDRVGIAAYLAPRLPDGLDPDEFIAREGVDGWRTLVERAVHFYRHKAESIVREHKKGTEWTDKGLESAVDEAIAFDASAPAEKATALSAYFWPVILEATGVDGDALQARMVAAKERQRTEKARKDYELLLHDVGAAFQKGSQGEGRRLLQEGVDRLRAEERLAEAEPVLPVADELEEHESYLRRFRGLRYIGLAQETLPSLDTYTLGLRGLILLAAAPNTGKTALGLQLGVDVVEKNKDACFLFLSLEMSRLEMLTRLKCRLAHMDWETITQGSFKFRGKSGGVHFTEEDKANLLEAEEKLKDLGRRVLILDERNCPEPTVEKVLEHLRALKARSGASRAFVLVDYLQVWPIPSHVKVSSDIEADKWRIGAMKSLRASLEGDAVMVISEARKPSGQASGQWGGELADVMGSARGTYTPDIVFLFRPYSDAELAAATGVAKKAKDWKGSPSEELLEKLAKEKVALSKNGQALNRLTIAKGRDGVRRGSVLLDFHYRQSRFEERRKDSPETTTEERAALEEVEDALKGWTEGGEE